MKGILVNYEYCTGCHSCEVACKKALGLGKNEYGIKVHEFGPVKNTAGRNRAKWEWVFTPTLTKSCDLCAERVASNKLPMCVQHCQAWCMAYGELSELVKKIDAATRHVLLIPEQG